MPVAEVTRIIAQREDADCAIVAISMLTGISYEDVLRTVVIHEPRWQGRKGLSDRHIRSILAELGTPVRKRRAVDYANDFGLLRLEDHIVLLRNGLVVEDNQLAPVDQWRRTRGYAAARKVTGIFVPVES